MSPKELFRKQVVLVAGSPESVRDKLAEVVAREWFTVSMMYAQQEFCQRPDTTPSDMTAVRRFIEVLEDLPNDPPQSHFPKVRLNHDLDNIKPNTR